MALKNNPMDLMILDIMMPHLDGFSVCKTAKLDFSRPCGVTSPDEFGGLSKSLNIMAQNLQQSFAKLEEANDKLEQDVEQKRRLLTERKELADNLSHEMKTPLGVIRAYAEGLQDETDEAKRQKYSEVIISETERMSSLITTLLDLSALENGATQLHPERFDFVEFLETVAGRLLIDTPDADFDLQYELPAFVSILIGLFVGRISDGLMAGVVYIKIMMIVFMAVPILYYLAGTGNKILACICYLIPSSATFEGIMDLANGGTGIISEDIAILAAHCVVWFLLYLLISKCQKKARMA